MDIFTSIQSQQFVEKPYEPTDPQIKDWSNTNSQASGLERNSGIKAKESISPSKILSPTEKTTLQMLFGGKKPEEFTFYGKSKILQIHKGNLFDIIG